MKLAAPRLQTPDLSTLLKPLRHVPSWLDTRIDVPEDLEPITTISDEVDPGEVGLTPRDVRRMWNATLALFRLGAHPSIELTVLVRNKVILNRAVGYAWGGGPRDTAGAEKVLATPGTPYCVFSTSKAYTATVVHALAERGWFDLDDLVADYIPGYEKNGKGATTIRHVLTHKAGVPFLQQSATDLERAHDRDFIRQFMIDAKPVFKPGSRLAYHALTGGYILGEVVHAATGKDIRTNLAELALDPLGFRWGNYGVRPEDVDAVAPTYLMGPPIPPPFSYYVAKVLSGSMGNAVELSQDPRFLTAIVPSANTVTSTEEMARFFDILASGGQLDGVKLLRPETLRAATETSSIHVPDLALAGVPIRYGQGYMMGAERLSLYGQHADRAFGHIGMMNTIGYADPERALAVGLNTSGKLLVYEGLLPWITIPAVIAKTVPKIPASEVPF